VCCPCTFLPPRPIIRSKKYTELGHSYFIQRSILGSLFCSSLSLSCHHVVSQDYYSLRILSLSALTTATFRSVFLLRSFFFRPHYRNLSFSFFAHAIFTFHPRKLFCYARKLFCYALYFSPSFVFGHFFGVSLYFRCYLPPLLSLGSDDDFSRLYREVAEVTITCPRLDHLFCLGCRSLVSCRVTTIIICPHPCSSFKLPRTVRPPPTM
jgi:hypothetical protein